MPETTDIAATDCNSIMRPETISGAIAAEMVRVKSLDFSLDKIETLLLSERNMTNMKNSDLIMMHQSVVARREGSVRFMTKFLDLAMKAKILNQVFGVGDQNEAKQKVVPRSVKQQQARRRLELMIENRILS